MKCIGFKDYNKIVAVLIGVAVVLKGDLGLEVEYCNAAEEQQKG